jgi:UDP-N-acetylglucosamine 2-epimerase
MATQTVKPTISILDAATGEQIDREMTDAEFEQFQIDQEIQAQANADKELQKQTKATATAKLAALGLTTDDLKALGLGGE